MNKKLAIITTHPIQYYAPLFKLLAQSIELKVFYTWGKDSTEKFDPGFGKTIQWDIPLLEGYEYEYLDNKAKNKGSHSYRGIKNPSIISKIKTFNPTTILVFGWCYDSHLRVLRHFKGKIPIYFRGDSNLLDNQCGSHLENIKTVGRRIFLNWVYRHIDKAFYVGTANKEYYYWVGLKEKQLIFAQHCIENTRFGGNFKDESNKIRQSFSISEDDIVILFAGKLESKKNPYFLLEAFLKANTQNVYLFFIGNGDEEEKLKIKAKESLKKNFIYFEDFKNQSQMPYWYTMSNIFCLPSRGPGETWGLAVNEAMECNNAIIISNKVGCYKDLVHKEQNGWVFENDNINQLVEIFENGLKRDQILEMGIKSKEIISNWSMSECYTRMLSEFKN